MHACKCENLLKCTLALYKVIIFTQFTICKFLFLSLSPGQFMFSKSSGRDSRDPINETRSRAAPTGCQGGNH